MNRAIVRKSLRTAMFKLILVSVYAGFWSFRSSITASDVVFGCFCDQNCFLSVVPIFSTTFGYRDKAYKYVLHS